MFLQSSTYPFVVGNKNFTLFEMVNHCTCNTNFTCARHIICSRPNNNLMTVNTFLMNNICFGGFQYVGAIVFDSCSIAVVISFIFYSININRSCYFVIIVLTPNFVVVRVSNIMSLAGTLWKMCNKRKEFILLVTQDKLKRHLNEIIPLLCSDSITCKSIELNK